MRTKKAATRNWPQQWASLFSRLSPSSISLAPALVCAKIAASARNRRPLQQSVLQRPSCAEQGRKARKKSWRLRKRKARDSRDIATRTRLLQLPCFHSPAPPAPVASRKTAARSSQGPSRNARRPGVADLAQQRAPSPSPSPLRPGRNVTRASSAHTHSFLKNVSRARSAAALPLLPCAVSLRPAEFSAH